MLLLMPIICFAIYVPYKYRPRQVLCAELLVIAPMKVGAHMNSIPVSYKITWINVNHMGSCDLAFLGDTNVLSLMPCSLANSAIKPWIAIYYSVNF